jgi:ubiquinone/menaquinone biosynthesis C-methylase UbiE
VEEPEYRRDLYRGTAEDYDRYRVPYPAAMLGDLLGRAGVSGRGRLLDLACGTGQIAFAMHRAFREVRAVDREPDMVALVRRKAEVAGIGGPRAVVAAAEALQAPAGAFELVAIGNAFHRLRRDAVAASARPWLRPGGCLALL